AQMRRPALDVVVAGFGDSGRGLPAPVRILGATGRRLLRAGVPGWRIVRRQVPRAGNVRRRPARSVAQCGWRSVLGWRSLVGLPRVAGVLLLGVLLLGPPGVVGPLPPGRRRGERVVLA